MPWRKRLSSQDRPKHLLSGQAALIARIAFCMLGAFALIHSTPAAEPQRAVEEQLAAGHALFAQGDFTAARAEYDRIVAREDAPPVFRSLAALALAQTFERERQLDRAEAAYAKVAQITDAPPHLDREARERIGGLTRVRAGLPARDPAVSRLSMPPLPLPGLTLHVAPDGNDAHSGQAGQPFATLERARDEIRRLKESESPPSGRVEVRVHGGEYTVRQTFTLDARDSGTADAPVVYRAADGEQPRFRGGIRLTEFRPVSDPAIRQRLPEEVRDKVVGFDLEAAGVSEVLPLTLGGFASGRGFRTHPAHELFFDGQAMQLARGPNEGFLRIKDVAVKDGTKGYDREGSKVGRFFYEGDRPARWTDEPDLLLYGYWFWDWADSYERVDSIDPDRRLITLEEPVHRYGFSIGAPFHAINALSELDLPAEWYLDRANAMLYFYPPSDPSTAAVELSMFPDTMVRMENVSHLRLEGLSWELGAADAVAIRGGTHCLIAGATIRRFAGNAVTINGGSGHGLLSCDIYSMGRGGIILSGGSRKTLSPGNHFVENCHIFDLSRLDRTYTPALLISGAGHRVAHNRLHEIRSSAMRVNGNDHLIELNEVFNVVLESDDQGGADMWGNATYRGNVYRHNYWHHVGGWQGDERQPKLGRSGIRLDDAISGTLIHGNIFHRASTGRTGFGAIQIHGGKDNIIDNNLFVECATAVSFTGWNDQRWREFVENALDDPAIDKGLYLDRYPELSRLLEDANANHLWRNVAYRCGEWLRRNPGRSEMIDNVITGNPTMFEGDYLPDHPGFAPIPYDEIGLYRDRFRPDVPEVTFPWQRAMATPRRS